MGRSDINTLSVSFEPVSKREIKPEAIQQQPSRVKVDSVLQQLLRCPSCDCKLSAPEAKMGRCLSCGSNLSATSGEGQDKPFTVGI